MTKYLRLSQFHRCTAQHGTLHIAAPLQPCAALLLEVRALFTGCCCGCVKVPLWHQLPGHDRSMLSRAHRHPRGTLSPIKQVSLQLCLSNYQQQQERIQKNFFLFVLQTNFIFMSSMKSVRKMMLISAPLMACTICFRCDYIRTKVMATIHSRLRVGLDGNTMDSKEEEKNILTFNSFKTLIL